MSLPNCFSFILTWTGEKNRTKKLEGFVWLHRGFYSQPRHSLLASKLINACVCGSVCVDVCIWYRGPASVLYLFTASWNLIIPPAVHLRAFLPCQCSHTLYLRPKAPSGLQVCCASVMWSFTAKYITCCRLRSSAKCNTEVAFDWPNHQSIYRAVEVWKLRSGGARSSWLWCTSLLESDDSMRQCYWCIPPGPLPYWPSSANSK